MRLLTIRCRIIFQSQWTFLSPNLLGMWIAPEALLPVATEPAGPEGPMPVRSLVTDHPGKRVTRERTKLATTAKTGCTITYQELAGPRRTDFLREENSSTPSRTRDWLRASREVDGQKRNIVFVSLARRLFQPTGQLKQ
jgi:hypothetical protein